MTSVNTDKHTLNQSLHLIGSRRYGVNEDDSDYDYLLIVAESKIPDILSIWKDADIIEYTNTPDLSTTLPVRIGYRVKGITNEYISSILSIPVGSLYDVLVIPRPDRISDSNFILENNNLYRMICTEDTIQYTKSINPDLKDRVKTIRTWAKKHGVYGGAYPDGMGYFLYATNTIEKGYSHDKALRMLSTRCLYYHNEYKYKHISYVSDKSLKHIGNILSNRVVPGRYQYQVLSSRMEEVLRLSKRVLDETPGIMYIENTGIIHASSDVSDEVSKWSEWLQSLGIENRVLEMK